MEEEKKIVNFKIDGDCVIIGFDPNKDGKNVLEIKTYLLEIPSEIAALLKK